MDQLKKDIKIVIKYIHFRYQNCDLDMDYLFSKTDLLYKLVKYNLNIIKLSKQWIYLTSMLIILKFINDENISNRDFARTFKIPLKILNFLEYEILKIIDFNVYEIIENSSIKLSIKNIFSF